MVSAESCIDANTSRSPLTLFSISIYGVGALFDAQVLRAALKENIGDVTFQEAYNRTRRILNITVSTSANFEMPRLLNYLTAPNVLIWSAVYVTQDVMPRMSTRF
jgi:predicted acylesterase/phospholipase RssA